MFDGAAAAAADQHHNNSSDAGAGNEGAVARPASTSDPATRTAASAAPAAAGNSAPSTPPAPAPQAPTVNLVVVDARVEGHEQLTAGLPGNTRLLVVDNQADGLAAISAALAELGHVDSIQIFSHGSAGQFTLGNSTIDAASLQRSSDVLAGWRAGLNAGADIQLYGCDIGAGNAGQTLVREMSRLTGADVGASSDATGNALAGGNWTLEVASGTLDKSLALNPDSVSAYASLLDNAAPTVTMGSAGSDVLLGDQVSFVVNFSNASTTQVGFAPYIDLFLPATGKDGDDGVSFVSASYLGQGLAGQVVTFDAAGNATHPFARDASGNPVIVTAASVGMRPGDQMVVISLPYGSVSADQPTIAVNVTLRLSNLADTAYSNGSPDLGVTARGGFQFGNDALNNPKQDPTLIGAISSAFNVHPTVLTFDTTINTPEGETATGPNYGRTLTVTATPAPGQTLTNVEVTQTLPGTVQVTAITPGAGGTLSSIRLHGGTVLTDPAEIAAAIADDVFIDEFTVTYATLSAATNTVVSFYVPDADAEGVAVLDPDTGDARTITVAPAQATGEWVPLDPRDLAPPATEIDFAATGDTTNFVARSIALIKRSTLQTDLGHAGLTPGDTLAYQLDITISDFFTFGRNLLAEGTFVLQDRLGDGQALVGTPTMTVTVAGVTRTIALVTTTVVNADGSTSIAFDIAQSLFNDDPLRAFLSGDLSFDDMQQGATSARINYTATVGQSYTPPAGLPHNEINEGDAVGNNSAVTASILNSGVSVTGSSESDTSSATATVPTSTVDIALVTVNGGTPPANGELRPGDLVTFRMSYDLVTGDYESFSLSAYLPQPLFNLAGAAWTNGSGDRQWVIGPGNTNAGSVLSVTTGPGNSVLFNFGDHVVNSVNGSQIVVEFTLRVGDQPFADQRSLSVLAQSSQMTTLTDQRLVSNDIATIASVAEPVLDILHGVVSTSHGTVTGTTGSWNAPGSGGAPFTGSVTSLTAIDGRVDGVDAGDTVRLATAIENSGGGNAFDVVTSIALPAGFGFAGGSLATANLLIYRGDGTPLTLGVDYSVAGNTITFLDANNQGTLLAGRPGSANDTSGANLVVITYDTVVQQGIEASRTLQSTGTLSNYASVDGGADFTPTDLTDTADQQVAAPGVGKVFADGSLDNGDSSATHTTGANLVVGESMLYDIVVTLPEGVTPSLAITDLIPNGLRLDMSFNGGLGYQLLTTTAQSGALAANFNGVVAVGSVQPVSGTLGDDGVDPRFVFSSAQVTGDNVTGNNSFVIRVRLVASNVIANQAGSNRDNSAQVGYSDLDGDTPNGSTAIDRTIGLAGGAPRVTVVEPTLTVTQTLISDPGLGFDDGDVVTWQIVIGNGTAASDFDAFDISLLDVLPAQLSNIAFDGAIIYAGGATNNGGPDFVLSGTQLLSLPNANIDIARGGSITIRLTGTVNATAAAGADIPNTATVQWTSLNGAAGGAVDPAGERTGLDGLLNSGALNDYRVASTLSIPVAEGIRFSRVGGLTDTPAPNPTDAPQESVTVGEIVRYRVAVLVPEGDSPGYRLQLVLDPGLEFIMPTTDDGSGNFVNIALISNGPPGTNLVSDAANLVTQGNAFILGNEDSGEAQLINPLLDPPSPTAVFNRARISVATVNGQQVVTFDLGNLSNPPNDADLEGVVMEFNVRVTNVASVVAGAQLGATVNEVVGGAVRSQSDRLVERVVEPSFTGFTNRVIDFDPNPSGGTGTATFQVDFTQNGGLSAYDTRLAVNYPGATNYQLISITIDGTTYLPGAFPPGVSSLTGPTGAVIDFAQIDVGTSIQVVYQATLPNLQPIQPVNTILTWTSLPESFTNWGGDTVGTDGDASGERTGSGIGPNTYILRTPAGLGQVAGALWNDTATASSDPRPDLGAPVLAGQVVTLTWAGLDGDFATTGDNRTFTTLTDASGLYRFSLLPSGQFRISVNPGPVTAANDPAAGQMDVRIDTDGGVLGQVNFAIDTSTTAGTTTVVANFGYVERNDPPTLTVPGTQNGLEDVPLPIHGITVADPDAERNPNPETALLTVRLNVGAGTLNLSSAQAGVTAAGLGTATVFLTGRLADLNLALDKLVYQGIRDYNGNDRLFVIVNDNGNFGDANNRNGLPGEAQDALSATADFQIVLAPVNDPPIAVDDAAGAVEAGGTDNNQFGVDPRGGLLGNDRDPDLNDVPPHEVLTVTEIGRADGARVAVPATGLQVVQGLYGRLVVDHNGLFQYIVDNNNPTVEALRTSGQTLTESFDYVVRDTGNLSDIGRLTVTIRGANDAPIASDDLGSAIEAGGVFNGTPGSDAVGNVLANDRDKDVVGEALGVTGVRLIPPSNPGPVVPIAPGTGSSNGTVVAGLYGTLTIGADGSYRYVVDNGNAAVQALVPGQILDDVFSYRVTDVGGLDDVAELRIRIEGRQDNPVATDNSAVAQAAPTDNSQPEVNPAGNVITDNNGSGVDSDVDSADNPNTVLHVGGIRTGAEAAGGALAAVATGSTSTSGGTVLQGLYGTLTIGANGSYIYDVDSGNAAVQALRPGSSLNDVFTYQLVDTAGLTDLAQLTVQVNGVNDPPVAGNLTTVAIEAGGAFNATPGLDPSDTVQRAVSDPDGDTISVTFIRTGQEIGTGTDQPVAGSGNTVIAGTYGTLTIRADGSFTYVVDNLNPAVQALRTDLNRLQDVFTFTVNDGHGLVDRGEITIEIHGRNDNPVGVNDTAGAVEAGGTANATPGVDPTGNVFDNDTDVDANDQLSVLGARAGTEAAGGTFTGLPPNGSSAVAGTYGTLTIFTNGNYQYVVNNANAAVNALRPGQTLSESFTYSVRDLAGGADFAQLDVTIGGAWDAPVAENNIAYAVADNPFRTAINPTGNVITDDNIFGLFYGRDTDVDNGDVLTVSSIRTGPETGGTAGPDTAVAAGSTAASGGVRLTGQYGWLTIGADGSYLYEVDSSDPAILALGPLGFVTETFTYTARDLGGLTDQAQLTVLIRGVNQAPIANPDQGNAIEAGGVLNGTLGLDPDVEAPGVLGNDTDVENDPRLVVGVRAGDMSGGAAVGGLATTIQGLYGTLTMQRNGEWTYVVDNDLPAVEALRITGQTLTDVFTYTITDVPWGARATSELRVVIDGRNDDPVANDDAATAVEAGGVGNATPGVDPTGNVLDNDTDVDSVALGETRQVLTVSGGAGASAPAGSVLQGTYGQLLLNADGSYAYTVDNDNPTVQALRTAGETLAESFVYTMRDTAGARSTARLTITLQGANDNPVARDDSSTATDQVVAPQTFGNVLPNDSDVDGGDALQVVGIRSGAENGTGTAGSLDQPLAGRYGTLVIHADGSYTYTIDQTNPEVLAAAGMGQVLSDTFTYTVADRAGATDLAQLVIKLDISAPYVGPQGDQIFANLDRPGNRFEPLPQVQPAVFVEPVVRQVAAGLEISSWGSDGTQTLQQLPRENASPSIGAGLVETPGQFVSRAVAESRIDREFSLARMTGRESRVDLSADHLLPDPSIFTIDPANMFASLNDVATPETAAAAQPEAPRTASSFSEQLRAAARERGAWPMAGLDRPLQEPTRPQ